MTYILLLAASLLRGQNPVNRDDFTCAVDISGRALPEREEVKVGKGSKFTVNATITAQDEPGYPTDRPLTFRIRRFVPGLANSSQILSDDDSSITKKNDSVSLKDDDTEYVLGRVGIALDAVRPDKTSTEIWHAYVRVTDGTKKNVSNGIQVDRVKQYDIDSLLLLLQGLNSQLAGLQLVGGSALTNSFGQFQGASASSSWFGAQATPMPIPGVTTTAGAPVTNTQTQLGAGTTTVVSTTPTNSSTSSQQGTNNNQTSSTVQYPASGGAPTTNQSGSQNSTGSTTNNSTTQNSGTQQTTVISPTGQAVTTTNNGGTLSTVTTQPAYTFPTVAQPSQLSTYSYSPNFGPGPQSILQDQVNISYQVFNIQMLLQGALTDRYYGGVGTGTGSKATLDSLRYRTTVGIPITLNPGPKYRGDVAEVEVSLCSMRPLYESKAKKTDYGGEGDAPPALIALMPMENSYNVATMKQHASQLQIGANISLFSIGIGGGNASQQVFLERDTDTLALLRPSAFDDDLQRDTTCFAWQFRPVLGEPSVRSGTRTLFASIALPVNMVQRWSGFVRIKTSWHKYNQGARIVDDQPIDGSTVIQDLQELDVANGYIAEGQGGANEFEAAWQDAGDGKNVTIDVDGANFMPGTQVHAGPSTFAAPTNLYLGNRSLSFTMPANLLGISDPYILSPYGTAVRIRQKGSYAIHDLPFNIDKQPAYKALSDKTTGHVTIHVVASSTKGSPELVGPADAPNPHVADSLSSSDPANSLPPVRLLADVGGQVFGLEGNPLIVTKDAGTPALTIGQMRALTFGAIDQAADTDPSFINRTDVITASRFLKKVDESSTAQFVAPSDLSNNLFLGSIAKNAVGYTIEFDAPLSLLKAAHIVKLVNPLWGEQSCQFETFSHKGDDTPKDPTLAVFRVDKDTTTLLLTADKSFKGDISIEIPPAGPRPAQRIEGSDGSYYFTVENSTLHAIQQVIVHLNDSTGKRVVLVPFSSPPIPSASLSVKESVHVHDEFRITITGADLTSIMAVYYDKDMLSDLEHVGKDLIVKIDQNVTKTAAAKRELTLVDSHGNKSYVQFAVLP